MKEGAGVKAGCWDQHSLQDNQETISLCLAGCKGRVSFLPVQQPITGCQRNESFPAGAVIHHTYLEMRILKTQN